MVSLIHLPSLVSSDPQVPLETSKSDVPCTKRVLILSLLRKSPSRGYLLDHQVNTVLLMMVMSG